MTAEIPENKPEKEQKEAPLDDNARKFKVGPLDIPFLEEQDELTSFKLTVHWLETDENSEKKLAYKDFGDKVQILLISKITDEDGNRTTEKKPISQEEYDERKKSSILDLEKTRHEFTYVQNDIPYSLKLDMYNESELCVLEVDASTEEERDSFDPSDFPSELEEVTGNIQYYGYRVASIV